MTQLSYFLGQELTEPMVVCCVRVRVRTDGGLLGRQSPRLHDGMGGVQGIQHLIDDKVNMFLMTHGMKTLWQ
jgi:hypothetical protein